MDSLERHGDVEFWNALLKDRTQLHPFSLCYQNQTKALLTNLRHPASFKVEPGLKVYCMKSDKFLTEKASKTHPARKQVLVYNDPRINKMRSQL